MDRSSFCSVKRSIPNDQNYEPKHQNKMLKFRFKIMEHILGETVFEL